MIIDKTNPDHADIPDNLEGEVLLDRASHGFITCTLEKCHEMKAGTPEQRAAKGWSQYEAIVQAVDTTNAPRPALQDYKDHVINCLEMRLQQTRFKSIENVLNIFKQAKAYRDAGYPADVSDYPFIELESMTRGIAPQVVADAVITRVTNLKAKLIDIINSNDVDVCMMEHHNLDDIDL